MGRSVRVFPLPGGVCSLIDEREKFTCIQFNASCHVHCQSDLKRCCVLCMFIVRNITHVDDVLIAVKIVEELSIISCLMRIWHNV